MSGRYTGTCNDMCPERERCLRLGPTFHLSIFERDKNCQPDEYAMVKEYRRAGADQEEPLPEDLRTLKALETTMDYLVCNIMDDSKKTTKEFALEWYDFLWDRLRAIRKDITQQGICDEPSTVLVERCARFHIHTCYAMNRIKNFDVSMNRKVLNDCLQMVRQMYTDLRLTGIYCASEIEFQKYDILLHLNDDLASVNVLMKTSDYKGSQDMKFVTQIFYAFTNSDYYRFFKLLRQADYMTSCVLSLHINKVRLTALKMIVAACPPKQTTRYPTDLIIDSLEFDDIQDLTAFVSQFDIEIQQNNGNYYLILQKELASSIRQTKDDTPPVKSWKLVESKAQGRGVGQLVYGCNELPQNPYRLNELNTSSHSIKMNGEASVIETSCEVQFVTDPNEEMIEEDDPRQNKEIANSLTKPWRESIPTSLPSLPVKAYELPVEDMQVDQMVSWDTQAQTEATSVASAMILNTFPQTSTSINPPQPVFAPPMKRVRPPVNHFPVSNNQFKWTREKVVVVEKDDKASLAMTPSYTTTSTTTSTTTTAATTVSPPIAKTRTPSATISHVASATATSMATEEPVAPLDLIASIIPSTEIDTLETIANIETESPVESMTSDDEPTDNEETKIDEAMRLEVMRDIMPVGRFRKSKLSRKVPYLKAPPSPKPTKPTPRVSLSPKSAAYAQALKDLNTSIQDEQTANSRLSKLIRLCLE